MKSNAQASVHLKDLTESPLLLENFLTDGKSFLRKRNGYKKLLDLSVAPKYVYINGSSPSDSVKLVLENYVSGIDLESLYESPPYDTPRPITRASSSVIRYGNENVIFDGMCVCQSTDGTTQAISGYVPLCANGWDVGKKGEIFERLNLLSNHFRATYRFTRDSSTIYLPFPASSVDRVIFNGNTVEETEYELLLDGDKIYCFFLDEEEEEGVVTVYASVDGGFVTESVLARCRAASCYGEKDSIAYVFGSSQEGDEVKLFFSTPSHEKSDDGCRYLYGVNSDLCFFEGDELMLPSGKEVRAVFPTYEKALIFSDDEVYLLEKDGRPALLFSGAGGICNQSVSLFGKDVVFVGKNGLFRLTLADKKESCKLSRLLSPSRFPKDFLSGACLVCDADSSLVYVYNSLSDEGAFVYSLENGILSHFTGLRPHVMFCFGSETYFTTDDKLFVFAKDSYSDSPDGESSLPINARFESTFLDLGSPFTEKKLDSVSLRANGHATVSVSLALDGEKSVDVPFKVRSDVFPAVLKRKLPRHRFHSLCAALSDAGEGELCVSALEIFARELKRK